MIQVVLFEPEIPPNTGNIIRLCANIGANLHLVEPIGFELDDKRMRRAGLDYHEWVDVKIHANFAALKEALGDRRLLCCETSGQRCYADVEFKIDDAIIFGSETRGLPPEVLNAVPAKDTFYLPMHKHKDIRSLNLSNSVAVAVYEAWRQLNFVA